MELKTKQKFGITSVRILKDFGMAKKAFLNFIFEGEFFCSEVEVVCTSARKGVGTPIMP
jgi:hypothetical protein